MQPDFWHERWALQQTGFHQEEINAHLQQLWPALGVAPGGHVFVPLCGKSADMLWLRAQGHEVTGVEISPLAVQAFFADNDLAVTVRQKGRFEMHEADGIRLFCGDFFDLAPEDLAGLHAVYDRAALVALPPRMRAAYASHMGRLFPPATKVLLVTFDYPQHEMQGPPFSVQEAEVRRHYGEHCAIELVRDGDILDLEPRFRERGVSRLQEKVYVLTYN